MSNLCVHLVPILGLHILLFTCVSLLCLIHVLSQTISCKARRDFMEHVKIPLISHQKFELTLVRMSRSDLSYKVLVTNDIGQTYFCGSAWRKFTDEMEMRAATKCKLYLEEGENFIFYTHENPNPGIKPTFLRDAG